LYFQQKTATVRILASPFLPSVRPSIRNLGKAEIIFVEFGIWRFFLYNLLKYSNFG